MHDRGSGTEGSSDPDLLKVPSNKLHNHVPGYIFAFKLLEK